MATTARLVRRAGTHTTWLELDYDGLEPPVALLRELGALGWRPPAVATPPHDAIDWSRPDRARGLAYTIGPWRVVGATVDPPPGAGPRGAWTEGDAASHLPLLAATCSRHGLDVEGLDRTELARANPPSPSASPGPGTTSPPEEEADRTVLVSFVVEAEVAPGVRATLEADHLPHQTSPATINVPQRYRGRDFTSDVAAVRFQVATTADAVTALEAALDALGIDATLARLRIEPLEPGTDRPGLAPVHPLPRTRPRGVA